MMKAKKILCLVLSLIMLLGCSMIPSFAAVQDGKQISLRVEADRSYAKPGDVITYTMYVDLADLSTPLTNCVIYFSYNNTQLKTPTVATLNRTFLNDFAGFYKDASTVSVVNSHNAIKAQYTADELALFNAAMQIQANVDGGKGGTAAGGFTITDGNTAQMTLQMTVADGVADGTVINFGVSPAGFLTTSRGGYLKAANGTANGLNFAAAAIDLSQAMTTVTVGEEAPAAPVWKSASHVKATLNAGKTDIDYAVEPLKLRVITEIDKDFWDANFAPAADESGKITTNITNVGIVAFNGDAAKFDSAKAEEVARMGDKGMAETADGKYMAATTNYIQKVDGQNAKFAARLEYDAKDKVTDVTYVAFVQYGDGQIQFYSAPVTTQLLTNYSGVIAALAQ